MKHMKVLVIAPHPDDEVLGCGATIAKYTKILGNSVTLCIITEAYEPEWSEEFIKKTRPAEIEKVQKTLGIKDIVQLKLPTVKLDTIPQKELNAAIYNVIKKVKPEILYIPFFGDINRDHELVAKATLVAARPLPNSTIKEIYMYETLSETEWGFQPFVPNVYEDISLFIESKLRAMAAYKSELKKEPHPRSENIIISLAKKRGSEVGVNYAEAFILVRKIS